MKLKHPTLRWLAIASTLVALNGIAACAHLNAPASQNAPSVAAGATKARAPQVDPFELAQLADSAYMAGRLPDAQHYYQLLTTAVPKDGYAWFQLGNILLRQGDIVHAQTAYLNSLERDKGNPKAWYNLATARLMNAQLALRGAAQRLSLADPARQLTEQRLAGLDKLISQRLEEIQSPVISELPDLSRSSTR